MNQTTLWQYIVVGAAVAVTVASVSQGNDYSSQMETPVPATSIQDAKSLQCFGNGIEVYVDFADSNLPSEEMGFEMRFGKRAQGSSASFEIYEMGQASMGNGGGVTYLSVADWDGHELSIETPNFISGSAQWNLGPTLDCKFYQNHFYKGSAGW